MKKWIVALLSLLLITLLLLISSFFSIFKPSMIKRESGERPRILLTQDEEEKKVQSDPYLILVLKRLREKLDEWLKSINDRIESENITRLEVRFLEIWRIILEWVIEKVNAKIESSEKEKPKETHQRAFPFFEVG
jgi:hypothetical protein